jgi:signal transduction histidine kinase
MFTRARVLDVAVAAGMTAAAEAELVSGRPSAAEVALVAAACGALAWRRVAPLATFAVILAAVLLAPLLGDWETDENASVFVVALAGYSIGAHAPLRRATAALLGFAALTMGVDLATGGSPSDAYFLTLMLGMPWLSGCLLRRYRERAARLRVLAAQLERERDLSAGLARARERRRLAGEVHRAVAAAIGGVVGALDRAARAEPAAARAALEAAQRTGRAAVAELQGVLGALRADAVPREDPVRPAEEPPRSWWPAWGDLALAGAVTFISAVSAFTSGLYAGVRWPMAGLALAGLAIAIRRAHPVTALLIGLAAGAAESLLIGEYGEIPAAFVAQLLTLYTLAASRPIRSSAPWLAVAALVDVAIPLAQGYLEIADLLLMLLFVGVPWLSGLGARRLHVQADELRRLTARLAAERDARARLATTEERARVARDLHDSCAHAVSVMVLQAGAAEAALERDPEAAHAAIAAAAAQGRRALDELRELLGVLAAADGGGDLGALVDGVRRAGLPAELRVRGERQALPAEVAATTYRIVQEALTNTLKHAGPVPTTVTLDYAPGTLAVEVRDAGGGADAAAGGGHGLVGMRERVAEHGGTLEAGPRAGGGFTVRAELPWEAV